MFIIFCVKFKSMIRFELIFVKGKRSVFELIFFACRCSVVPALFVKKTKVVFKTIRTFITSAKEVNRSF